VPIRLIRTIDLPTNSAAKPKRLSAELRSDCEVHLSYPEAVMAKLSNGITENG
jgi:hypothetical protein